MEHTAFVLTMFSFLAREGKANNNGLKEQERDIKSHDKAEYSKPMQMQWREIHLCLRSNISPELVDNAFERWARVASSSGCLKPMLHVVGSTPDSTSPVSICILVVDEGCQSQSSVALLTVPESHFQDIRCLAERCWERWVLPRWATLRGFMFKAAST